MGFSTAQLHHGHKTEVIDGWMDGGMDGWMEGGRDTYIHTYIHAKTDRLD
jgi:hypothetical protein